MRQLKKLDRTFHLYGIEFGIKICCMIWFYCVWSTLRADKEIYQSYHMKEWGKTGIMLCPECVIHEIHKLTEVEQ